MNNFFNNGFKFIDLFAGIGGFHQAMVQLGGKCVFASEIDEETSTIYKNNYKIDAFSDIRKVDPNIIPDFDVLCAGFPCQSFSKAGSQKGFNDDRGVLFFDIVRILKNHIDRYGGPKYLILENVKNLVKHDDGNTWIRIKEELKNLDYNVIEKPIIVSPHYFDVPQLRERAVIVAVKNSYFDKQIDINFPQKPKNICKMEKILINKNNKEYDLSKYHISEYEEYVLKVWDEFIKGVNRKIIGFPIWTEYFYNKVDLDNYPAWKRTIVMKNLEFYNDNKEFIDTWYKKYNCLQDIKKTHRKFEWQVNGQIDSVFEGIIQFRPSGVRVKLPTEFPALVAMVHVPIIGKEKRYITPREAARLQSFPSKFKIDKNDWQAYKQFGNAVNVKVIKTVFESFVDFVEENNK